MIQSKAPLFLAQSYQDAYMDYKRSLTGEGIAKWDYIILTASNERQAEGFRLQLEKREKENLLPLHTHFAVIPDPEGKRVGSGGATLGVLRYIAEDSGKNDFSGLRILVIHSGGDSKRVPQYSALGKLFSPVPHEINNGKVSTLFDEFMISMAGVPSRMKEGMLLLSGDVLLLFNPLQIDYSNQGAAAISFKENVNTGKDHGVFLRGEDGYVKKFLHKQTVECLRGQGAVNENDCVDIDTGAVIFSTDMLQSLFSLITVDGKCSDDLFRKYVNETVRLSLYGDFLYPLAKDSTLDAFYREKPEGELCQELLDAREDVWNALHSYKLKLLRLAPAKFIHFGTSREIMKLMSEDVKEYGDLAWSNHVNCSISLPTVAGCNSIVSSKAECGENCYLEVSYVHHNAKVGKNTLLSYIDAANVEIPSDVVVHGLKQKNGKFVVRIYGIAENPKNTVEENAVFLGKSLSAFLEKNHIAYEDIWDTDDHSVWNARLYPECDTIAEALREALHLYALVQHGGDIQSWLRQSRKSLQSGFLDADPHALIAWEKRMQELVYMDKIGAQIRSGVPMSRVMETFTLKELTPIQLEWVERRLSRADYSEAIRIYYYLGWILGGQSGDKYVTKSFKIIRNMVLDAAIADLNMKHDFHISCDSHTVKMPLRVNWGGGWSDTSPYCNENGGTVLNAAILLNGQMPVEVSLWKLDEQKIVFDSRDMDVHGEFTSIESLQKSGDPYDPFALQKAALLACGVIPGKGGNLHTVLEKLGGGFHMQTEVRGVPKGSGLGTSSILAAACVKAIFEFMGASCTQDELSNYVFCMEQIMSTGGGWQDQIGGLVPGIKYITAAPGKKQNIHVEQVAVPADALQELKDRFALIYTGQRRLARNLLRNVVGRYIGNEKESVSSLNEIQRVAALMRFELERGHIDDFAELLNQHWILSQKIDSGSTNTLINHIFSTVDELIDGKMICGAGGGGFLQVIMKPNVTRKELHEKLKNVFQDSDIDVWNCELI